MKILALILARKNSKRLTKKNLRILGHKPLISWTIDLLKKIKHIDNILVSTDSKKIQKIALKSNVLCPKMRPKYLSGDKTTSEQSALYELRWYEKSYCKVDGLLLMQPTSPFRTIKNVNKGIKLFKRNPKNYVIGVSKFKNEKINKKNVFLLKDNLLYLIKNKNSHFNKTSRRNLFYVNGYFYLVNKSLFLKTKSFKKKVFSPLIINSPKESLDIDTHKDLLFAKKYVKDH